MIQRSIDLHCSIPSTVARRENINLMPWVIELTWGDKRLKIRHDTIMLQAWLECTAVVVPWKVG
jgi:hypothetical protein